MWLNNTKVISLTRRQDRRDSFDIRAKNLGIDYTIFDAIDMHELEYQGPLLKGEEACRQSHLQLLKQELAKKSDYYLVFEDDADFHPEFMDLYQKGLESIHNDFDMLYLGASFRAAPIHKINDYLVTSEAFHCTHAMLIKNSAYEKLVSSIEKSYYLPVDNAMSKAHPEMKVYCFYPTICWQINDFSDIQQHVVNYHWLK